MSGRALAIKIIHTLRRSGYEALLAGGCVRDLLMRRRPKDYDVATSALPKEVKALFRKTLDVGAAFGVIVVKEGGEAVEVATFRAEADYADGRHPQHVSFCSAKEDALRRDFTINGMFYDPIKRQVIDYVGGQRDLKRRQLRAIGNPEERFREDHLRMLRAVRFACRFDFAIERETMQAICKNAGLIRDVSAERIRDELAGILLYANRSSGVRLMSEAALLKHIFPEVEAMKGVEQGPYVHPEGDVFEHTVLCLEHLRRPGLALVIATLLHDVGKPLTIERRDGKIRFFRHESVGAQMAGEICERLRLSRDLKEQVVWLVKQHMVFGQVRQMRPSTLKKLCAAPGFADVLELYRADALASGGKPGHYRYVLGKCRDFQKGDEIKPKPLINGRDLIKMGLKPGPIFKRILSAVYDAQLDDEVSDKSEALALARKIAKQVDAAG